MSKGKGIVENITRHCHTKNMRTSKLWLRQWLSMQRMLKAWLTRWIQSFLGPLKPYNIHVRTIPWISHSYMWGTPYWHCSTMLATVMLTCKEHQFAALLWPEYHEHTRHTMSTLQHYTGQSDMNMQGTLLWYCSTALARVPWTCQAHHSNIAALLWPEWHEHMRHIIFAFQHYSK